MMQNPFRIAVFVFLTLLLVLLSRNFNFFNTQASPVQKNMSFQVVLREGIVGGFAGPTIK